MKNRWSFAAVTLAGVFAVSLLASGIQAQTAINVGTAASGSASYNPFSGSAGPFPFSNFGVSASANLGGTDVSLNTGGLTSFLLPNFTNGEVLAPGGVGGTVGYTPQWTGSLGDTSVLAANASFNYNIGPFSGSNTIFNQNLNNNLSGSLASGGALTGGSATSFANGNLFSFGYSQSALFASASATINVGLQYQSSLSWNPTATYGVNSWISTTPDSAPTGAVSSSSVSSGALAFNVPGAVAPNGGEQLYLNLQPTVTFNAEIDPNSVVSTPVSGNLNVSAFGNNVINYNFPIANPFALPITYGQWDASAAWASSEVLSVPVEEEFLAGGQNGCPLGERCAEYVVDEGTFTYGVLPTSNGQVNNLTGGSVFGGWNPNLNGGLAPPICDANGNCYASNDPNLPVGAASSAVISDTAVGTTATPEPRSWILLLVGLVVCATGKMLFTRRMDASYA
jgi:hypothetical protein